MMVSALADTCLGRLTSDELHMDLAAARGAHAAFRARGLKLDMTRGKPSPEQVALSADLLSETGNGDWTSAAGEDVRNYGGGIQGLPEFRAIFAEAMGAPPERIVAAGNSSLALMHDCIVYALLSGVPGGNAPWREGPVRVLCPVPGYDRHFSICEAYGIEMMTVPLTGAGPDMDVVEELVRDHSVKAMWCVPQYSNPTGETYSDEVVARLARMPAAPDFRLFWDNAYAVHDLVTQPRRVADVMCEADAGGHPDRPLVFMSTSKMTFGGAGISLLASSDANVGWYVGHASRRTIGPDKINQLRHARFLRDAEGLAAQMERHRVVLAPKFAALDAALTAGLAGTGLATWTRPAGGYFVMLEVSPRCAGRVVALAAEGGLALTPAGATYPYGIDPQDRVLRLAPTYPSVEQVRAAGEGIAICVRLAALELASDAIRASTGGELGQFAR